MVACEISKIRDLKTLFLIGSAVSKEEVNRFLSMLHPLANLVPMEWLRFSASKIPGELPEMFARAEASFVRSMCSFSVGRAWCSTRSVLSNPRFA
jgi:hypothetical protein